ncbi:MAG: ClpXP protease specificity-enhancing factor SspB [Pseudomonadota bacterium]
MANETGESKRLKEVIEALVARRIEESLTSVEGVLARWRREEIRVLEAHAEVVRHTARASVLSSRVVQAGTQGPKDLLRDALDAGVVSREEFIDLAGCTPEEVPAPLPLDAEVAKQVSSTAHDKRHVLEQLLTEGAVLVHLDAREEGVQVPEAHRGDARLVLRLGYRLSPPIPDLSVNEGGVSATLSFRGTAFGCSLPWKAIYAIAGEDGRGYVWPESVPPEVAKDLATEAEPGKTKGPSGSPPPRTPPIRRGHLRLV